jgi:hypothetical protein
METRRWLILTLALVAVVGVLGTRFGAGAASADGVATVNCSGGSLGLNDCTITLSTSILAGGSFTATLQNGNATFIACNTIPVGGSCSMTATTVTFTCPNGCAAGTTYRDVVQLSSGSGTSQSFTASGVTGTASTVSFPNVASAVFPVPAGVGAGACVTPFGVVVACGSGVIGFGGSCFTQGLIVPCGSLPFTPLTSNCLVGTNFGSFNVCNTTTPFVGVSPSCVQQSVVGIVNVCGGFNTAGCNGISPTGIIVNTCGFQPFTTPFTGVGVGINPFGFGINGACIQTLQTLSGPVTVQVC